MTEIYLIRHTQAEGNLYRMMQGHWDGEVTPLGYKEIDALAERLKGTKLDAVYSSDLRRAVLTAGAATRFNGLSVQTDRRLREIDLGPWEAQFFGNVQRDEPEQAEFFLHEPGRWKIPGAESMEDIINRAYPALVEIAEKHAGGAAAVVSHGVTIRCLMTKILGLSFSRDELLPISKNTSITKLLYENGSFTPEYIGDADHIAHLSSGDWVTADGLNDRIFDPSSDPAFYKACYQDAWHAAHNGDMHAFHPEVYYTSALEHHKACPGAVLKLYHQDQCVGLVDCDTERGAHAGIGWVSLLYLVPGYRGKGYGSQLLGRAVALYSRLGRHSLRLLTAASNIPALKFYERLGFTCISTEPGASGPLFLMEKKREAVSNA